MILQIDTYPRSLQCLAGLLTKDAHFAIPGKDGSVLLKEDDFGNNPNTLRHIKIIDLPVHTIVFSAHCLSYGVLEQDGNREGVWPRISCYRSVADYLIVTKPDRDVYFLYIELKTGFKNKKYIPQLRCARGHVEHLLYLIRHFDQDVFGGACCLHRFVKFTKRPLAKGVTAGDDAFVLPKPPARNDDPYCAYQCFVEEGASVSVQDLIRPFESQPK